MKKLYQYKIIAAAILLCFIGLITQPVVQAQIITPEENKGVLSIQQFDTRSLSMGSATVSDLYGRASIGMNPALSGLYINPVAFQINTNHNWNTNLIQHSLLLPTVSIQNHHFTARFGLAHQGTDNLNFWTDSHLPVPDVNIYHAAAAYAFSISSVFSMGVLQSVNYTFNDDAQYWTYSADFGLAYSPAENISYGMALRGLGHEINYEIIETGVTTLGSKLMQQSLEIGATFRFPVEERTFMTLSFSNEKRFGESGLWYKGGLELLPVSFIAFRGGFLFHNRESRFTLRTGLGIKFGPGSIDYMIAPKDMSGEYFHQLGITILF